MLLLGCYARSVASHFNTLKIEPRFLFAFSTPWIWNRVFFNSYEQPQNACARHLKPRFPFQYAWSGTAFFGRLQHPKYGTRFSHFGFNAPLGYEPGVAPQYNNCIPRSILRIYSSVTSKSQEHTILLRGSGTNRCPTKTNFWGDIRNLCD